METKEKNYFELLNQINVSDKTEELKIYDKNGRQHSLSYLSWAWAWGELKKRYPDSNYKIYERDTEFGPVNYFTDGTTCWVKTGVIVNGLEHIEELPVMDNHNNSIPLDKVTSFDVNKSIQRSLTKAVGRHGLGLYIYAGEDLPEDCEKEEKKVEPKQPYYIDKQENVCAKNVKNVQSVKRKVIEESQGKDITYSEAMGHTSSPLELFNSLDAVAQNKYLAIIKKYGKEKAKKCWHDHNLGALDASSIALLGKWLEDEETFANEPK